MSDRVLAIILRKIFLEEITSSLLRLSVYLTHFSRSPANLRGIEILKLVIAVLLKSERGAQSFKPAGSYLGVEGLGNKMWTDS